MPAAGISDDGETLAEASRLLQEGLELLAARTAEAEQQVAAARAEAERILADAARQRSALQAELEALQAQVDVLHAQIERARVELARVRAEAGEATPAEVSDQEPAPRWGRPSSISAAQEAALHSRAARPRWLPRWLRS